MAGKRQPSDETEPAADARSAQLLPPPAARRPPAPAALPPAPVARPPAPVARPPVACPPVAPPPVAPPPRRERQTLVPDFDPGALAKELEAESDRPTSPPPYEASCYARIIDSHVDDSNRFASEARTVMAVEPAGHDVDDEHAIDTQTSGTLGRAMYGSYLQSDYPAALALAERVLDSEPDHALAQLVVEGCRARLGSASSAPRLAPSSVVRLRRPASEVSEIAQLDADLTSQVVIGHVDGVANVAMLAELAGIPRPEALDRLHALLDLGVLEVISG